MTLIPDMLAMVERFNREVIGLPVPDAPQRLDPERKHWAHGAMSEELAEFMEAETLEEEVDALVDLSYFAMGRLVEMGVLPGPVFEEVHKANMAKERGSLSKRPHSRGYDAVKPAGWTPPDLKAYLTIRQSDLEVLRFLDEMAGKNPTARLRAAQAAMQEEPAFQYGPDFVGLDFGDLEHRIMSMGFELPRTTREEPRPKVLVVGHARHGKDTVAGMLEDLYGLTFTSSSEFCAGVVVMPAIEEEWRRFHGASPTRRQEPAIPRYDNSKDCFLDRANHRAFWYNAITAFNTPDKTRLGRAIFETNDVYCGIRNPAEFHALVNAGIPDFVVWVDRSEHLPPEDRSSMGLEPWMADYVIDNNGSLADLERNVRVLFDRLMGS